MNFIEKITKKRTYILASLIIFAVTAAAVVVLMAVYLLNMRRSILDNASTYVENSLSSASGYASRYFDNRVSTLKRCSGQVSGIADDDEAIGNMLRRYCIEDLFARLAFVGSDGRVITSDGRELEVEFRLLAQEGSTNDRVLSSCETSSSFDLYTVPVRDDEGNNIGALVAGAPAADLANVISKTELPYSVSYYIVHDDGVVLFSDGSSEPFTVGENVVRTLQKNNDVNLLKTVLNQKNADGTCELKWGGEGYLISYSSIDGRKWTLISAVSVDSVLTVSRPMFVPSIIIIITVSAVFGILVIVLFVIAAKTRRNADEVLESSERSRNVDDVTGYNTWHKFLEDYKREIKDTAENQAILSLDIDNFKALNDLIGYESGNVILKQMADIIARNIKKNDIFARASADHFFILAGYGEKQELEDLAERIISDVAYQITTANLSISIGIYPITDRSISAYTASDRSDLARLRIKREKASAYMFFDASMLENIRSEHFIETVMESALEQGEFLVYLQPKYGLDDPTNVVGAEALVRWNHGGEIIPPGQFIPLFERNGFVTKIDYYIFREVCRLQKSWLSRGFEPKVISVNMSRSHLSDPEFVNKLSAYCREYDIDPKYFEIEITESAAFENMDILMNVFLQIKKAGFHVSIDDFGTGYSSLNMLKDLPVDVLKIDRSFLTESVDENENASKIIGCVVSLATALNISTICEGIETKEQANLLTKLGCNMAQGFFFARPMPVKEYEKLLYNIK